ncbi:MAG: nucleotide exchange factor GrpE [Salinivirgaceae bacterium]|nr:nucleotide exchange factor GrpE [Salinivirgaceae bacterium]
MAKKKIRENEEIASENVDTEVNLGESTNENNAYQNTDDDLEQTLSAEEALKQQVAEANDKYVRLVAEFDNYKKRTLRERIDLIKSAGQDILIDILPVVDDFERAIATIDTAKDIEGVKVGVNLIYGKFLEFLKQKGVVAIDAMSLELDTDKHEAITKIPAPNEELKGRIVDVITKGYYLNDKVIRFAKVVVGE